MNRGAWRRLMRRTTTIGRDRNGGGENAEAQASLVTSSCENAVVRAICVPNWRGVVLGSRQEGWRCGERNAVVALFGRQTGVMASSVRCYAAPLSRTGKSAANSTRPPKSDPSAPPEPEKPDRRINRAIVSRTIRLIIGDGHEILTRMEALRRAEHMNLDLVEVDGKQVPPVCKLMDFNKERFKDKQREKEMKKKQSERRRLDDLKEVRFSTRTEQNDLELKAQMALRLLNKGHRVKLAVVAHGNDEMEPKGRELIERMVALLKDSSKVETGPKIERQRAWLLVRPTSGSQSVSKTKKDEREKVERSSDSKMSDSDNDRLVE